MSNNLQLTIRESGSGKLAIIDGKTYSLLRLYRHNWMGGIFCLAVAGRIPLQADDLDEHWRVFRSGSIYLALDARPFSYHLIQGEGSTTDAPRWPRLKSPAAHFAFVGPTEEAVQAQVDKLEARTPVRESINGAIGTFITSLVIGAIVAIFKRKK